MAKKKTKSTSSRATSSNIVPLRPVREALTKSALVTMIADQNEIPRKTVTAVLDSLATIMQGSIHPKGVGEFTLPGMLKIVLRKVPARKEGTLIRNPATGEMMPAAAKPASVRVKVRPLSKLKTAATG